MTHDDTLMILGETMRRSVSVFRAVGDETFEVPVGSIARAQVRFVIDNAAHTTRDLSYRIVSYRVAAARVTCPRTGSSREAGN